MSRSPGFRFRILEVRQLDKLVDELARGKAMEKVMEHGAFDHHSIFINQKSINDGRIVIFYIDI